MKTWHVMTGLAAALLGWWWWTRREQGLPLIPAQWGQNPFAGFINDLAAPQRPQPGVPYLPPVVPDPQAGANWRGQAAAVGGTVGAAAAVAGCAAAGLGPLCIAAAPVGKVAGQLATTGAIKVGGAVATGAKAVGSGSVKVLKAIVPFW